MGFASVFLLKAALQQCSSKFDIAHATTAFGFALGMLDILLVMVMDMGKKSRRSGAFDVSAQNLQERFTIIFKDVGKAYNPLIGQQYCNDSNYQYQNGLNCLYMNFPK